MLKFVDDSKVVQVVIANCISGDTDFGKELKNTRKIQMRLVFVGVEKINKDTIFKHAWSALKKQNPRCTLYESEFQVQGFTTVISDAMLCIEDSCANQHIGR